MDRQSFLRKACGLGACSCLGLVLPSTNNVAASEDNGSDWKEEFVKHRFAKLIELLDSTLDEQTKNQIIENLGKECADNSIAKHYKNNLEGFFNEINKRWGEIVSYDKATGIIRVTTPERDCFCPLVDSKKISKSICQCSVGWQTKTYNTILGRDVKAKCLESVVRGSTKCVFEIQIV